MVYNIGVLVLSACLLTACAEGVGSKYILDVEALIKRGGESFQMMNSYAVIEHDFKRGRIMRARERVLRMEAAHRDYDRAQKLLMEKIEPARRRIFVHYLRQAKSYEKNKRWSDAMLAYEQAKAITIKPDAMEAKRWAMEQHMRQLRLDKLLSQKRKEDQDLLSYAPAYEPVSGISPRDHVYLRKQEDYNDTLDERAAQAYRESRYYLRKKQFGPAYVEMESHLRLRPDSIKGIKQMEVIQRERPAWLKVPRANAKRATAGKSEPSKRMVAPKEVTLRQIQAAMKKNELVSAKRLAQIYRRNGGKGANKLLTQIQRKLDASSEALFVQGGAAFQKEELDLAIRHWSRAVALTPENTEYVEALNRARQLKERLNLLRDQKDNDPIPEEE